MESCTIYYGRVWGGLGTFWNLATSTCSWFRPWVMSHERHLHQRGPHVKDNKNSVYCMPRATMMCARPPWDMVSLWHIGQKPPCTWGVCPDLQVTKNQHAQQISSQTVTKVNHHSPSWAQKYKHHGVLLHKLSSTFPKHVITEYNLVSPNNANIRCTWIMFQHDVNHVAQGLSQGQVEEAKFQNVPWRPHNLT